MPPTASRPRSRVQPNAPRPQTKSLFRRSRFRAIALALLLLSSSINLLAWGGLATLDEVGPRVALSARRESALASAYLWLGARLVELTRASAPARALADVTWGERYASILADPALATERLLDPAGGGMVRRLVVGNFWATPVLLLVWALLYALRERPIRTFG